MNIKIITVGGYFGQSLTTDVSLKVDELIHLLELKGYKTSEIDIQDLQHTEINNDTYYIIGSHQNSDIKKYIDDTLNILFIGCYEKLVIPGKKNILAHDNKGLQALLTKVIGEDYFPKQGYYYRERKVNEITVVKKIDGAGSSGVELISSEQELSKVLKLFSRYDYTLGKLLLLFKNYLKKYIYRNKYRETFTTYHKKYSLYCLQEFFPNLACDFKVLAFGKTLYVLKRDVRNGTFKASGSGKFSYPEAEDELLTFCDHLRQRIDTPYVSLDIVKLSDNTFKCIEFQCAHFGPYTQLNADKKYVKDGDGGWSVMDNDLSLEEAYSQSIDEYIKNLN